MTIRFLSAKSRLVLIMNPRKLPMKRAKSPKKSFERGPSAFGSFGCLLPKEISDRNSNTEKGTMEIEIATAEYSQTETSPSAPHDPTMRSPGCASIPKTVSLCARSVRNRSPLVVDQAVNSDF
jgi:hypothetical protein